MQFKKSGNRKANRVGSKSKRKIMEKFKDFEVKNQEMILGGEHIQTLVIYSNGAPSGTDIYDSAFDRWVDFE